MDVCAWCGSGFGSRYHEVCCEVVGALPLVDVTKKEACNVQ